MRSGRLDLGFPTPRESDPHDWADLKVLFVAGRPRFAGGGDRVWLRHGDRFIYSYEIQAVTYHAVRRSTIDKRDLGLGHALTLRPGSRRSENKRLTSIRDPEGVRDFWSRGLRYLTPGAGQFVRVGSR